MIGIITNAILILWTTYQCAKAFIACGVARMAFGNGKQTRQWAALGFLAMALVIGSSIYLGTQI